MHTIVPTNSYRLNASCLVRLNAACLASNGGEHPALLRLAPCSRQITVYERQPYQTGPQAGVRQLLCSGAARPPLCLVAHCQAKPAYGMRLHAWCRHAESQDLGAPLNLHERHRGTRWLQNCARTRDAYSPRTGTQVALFRSSACAVAGCKERCKMTAWWQRTSRLAPFRAAARSMHLASRLHRIESVPATLSCCC